MTESGIRTAVIPAGATIVAAPPPDETRFTPGAIVASRYRIVSLLGRGGAGYVFRADDLRLRQPVALKFVPQAVRGNVAALERLFAEVRLGREVSHPNVCRLHDLVDLDGELFITMELVDGEDLASLLRRIGRLPAAKAVEVARDICSGLAAMHDRGILHRDLKPANVMIDGRGSARLSDFGLAALADEVAGQRELAGTPVYMAPEQLAAGEVTVRSDLYALGLTLFETFSGVRLYSGTTLAQLAEQHGAPKPRLSALVPDIDPRIERVILQCLAEEPEERPKSVREVLAVLPAADPLVAAVQRGETPSPALVAAAGGTGQLAPRVAWSLAGTAIAFAMLLASILPDATIWGRTPAKAPDFLAERAREIAVAAGKTSAGRYAVWHWISSRGSGAPAFALLWRDSQAPFEPLRALRRVQSNDPPMVPGMSRIALDSSGALMYFEWMPDDAAAAGSLDPLLAATQLRDIRRSSRSTPPRIAGDAYASFDAYDPRQRVNVRIETATWNGTPVYVEVFPPSRASSLISAVPRPLAADHAAAALFLLVSAIALVFGWRNIVRGRVDLQGLRRVAAVLFFVYFAFWILQAKHSLAPAYEWTALRDGAGYAFVMTALICVSYLALEPYVRRRWPQALAGWSRLVAGRWRDPLVGRDVLIGLVAGLLAMVVTHLPRVEALGWRPVYVHLAPIHRAELFVGALVATAGNALHYALVSAFAFVLARLVLRRDLAALAAVALLPLFGGVNGPNLTAEVISELLFGLIAAAVVAHFGVLASAGFWLTVFLAGSLPLTLDFSVWYASRAVAGFVLLGALAAYGFLVALDRRTLATE